MTKKTSRKTPVKMPPQFGLIKRSYGLYEHDHLFGERLNDGEMLVILWPDGSEMRKRIKVIHCQDQAIHRNGGSYTRNTFHAFVTLKIRGAMIDVSLIGLNARRPGKTPEAAIKIRF